MIKSEEKEIDGVHYKCTQMPAMQSNKVLISLDNSLDRILLEAIAGSNMIDVLTSGVLFENVKAENATEICHMMMAGIRTKGVGDLTKLEVFDKHFRGRISHMYKVVEWSIHVNYYEFFYKRKEFKQNTAKAPSYAGRLKIAPNCDPMIWNLVTTNEGLNLENLVLLQTKLSIVDLYNALESRDVTYTNSIIIRKSLEKRT